MVYDLRHTSASLLLARNAPITYVAAQLGHANPSTTPRSSARWIPSRGQRWDCGVLRIVDERWEDYGYAAERFFAIDVPKPLEKALLKAVS